MRFIWTGGFARFSKESRLRNPTYKMKAARSSIHMTTALRRSCFITVEGGLGTRHGIRDRGQSAGGVRGALRTVGGTLAHG